LFFNLLISGTTTFINPDFDFFVVTNALIGSIPFVDELTTELDSAGNCNVYVLFLKPCFLISALNVS
jgi:hypothetical protein